jgi:hypothetical protein
MNTCVLLTLQESLRQCSAGEHDQWQGYMTILVINYGMITSISMLAAVIRTKIQFDADHLLD